MDRETVVVDVFGVLRIGDVLNEKLLARLKHDAAAGIDVVVMASTTIINIRKREELHAMTGWLFERGVPWNGLWMREKGDQHMSYTELKASWITSLDRRNLLRFYDFDAKCDPTWLSLGFAKAEDCTYSAAFGFTRIPCWVPEEAMPNTPNIRKSSVVI